MENRRIAFELRVIHNQIKDIIHKSSPRFEKAPKSQLQGGILGYLYHHQEEPVYQKDLEKEFRVSRATATNALQVMERDGFIVRKAQDKDARLKRILMTEDACRKHAQIEEHMKMMEERIVRGMTEAEVAELGRLLRMVHENLTEFSQEIAADSREIQH